MMVQYLKVYGDSKLIVNQVNGEYVVRHEDLILSHHASIKLADSFDDLYISRVSRLLNTKADALAVLAATLALPANATYRLTVATHRLLCLKYALEVSKVHTTSTNFEPRDWRLPIIGYALHGILPDDPKEADSVRRRFTRFYYDAVVKMLYYQSYDDILLCCLSSVAAREVLKEAHNGICDAHQPGPKLKD